MTDQPHVDVFYSYRSPYSYLAIGRLSDWTEGDHLAQAVARAGLDLDDLDRVVDEDAEALIQIIEDNQTAHQASGHWGIPTMVYRKEPFFGQDRIELLKWRVASTR